MTTMSNDKKDMNLDNLTDKLADVDGLMGGEFIGEGPAMQPKESDKTTELKIPEMPAPKKTDYDVDVCIIGGGFAGVVAAIQCKASGKSVLLVDKGSLGYSGYMPWANTFRWFDEELGDNREACKEAMKVNSEYTCNQSWYDIWMDESKEMHDMLEEWGFLQKWDTANASTKSIIEYHEDHAKTDRHLAFHNVLAKHGIDYIERTMIIDLIEEDGQAIGAMGIHVPSGAIITIQSKATILCAGAGSYKPTGFPTGSCTFDGEAMGYRHGLPIAGKEFSDFHGTSSYAPGNVLDTWGWTYVENMWLTGGVPAHESELTTACAMSTAEGVPTITPEMRLKAPPGFGGGMWQGLSKDDPRSGISGSPMGVMTVQGGAVGMGVHKSEGIFCGTDVFDGSTGLPGFYVAGDAEASMVCGAVYCGGFGFSAGMSMIQGRRAASATCKYVGTVKKVIPSAETIQSIKSYIQKPMLRTTGFNPNWARDILHSFMSPYWVNYMKTEATLQGALANVEFMRDNVIPKLRATNSHELRLCHEMENKILSAEMKLRTSLMRKESRGLHCRLDFPYRDDKNWLCYLTVQKGSDGSMVLAKVDYDDSFKGNLNEDYTKRYQDRFPGEAEALGLEIN